MVGHQIWSGVVKNSKKSLAPFEIRSTVFRVAHIAQPLYRLRYPGLSDNIENGVNYALINTIKANRNNLLDLDF